MFGKTGLLVVGLGAAVGVPYVATEWTNLKAKFTGTPAATSPSANSAWQPLAGRSGSTVASPPLATSGANFAPNDAQLEEPPLVEMSDALRFRVTPAGILARWPRVSAGLAHENLHGLRVPLITGTREDDLAGALTYYFNPGQRCAKITFSGSTGDPRRLMLLLQERFDFHRFPTSEPGVERLQVRWNGKPHSELIVRPARVVRAASPFARYEVQLSIVDTAAL